MKKILLIVFSILLIWGCNNQTEEENNNMDTIILNEVTAEEPDIKENEEDAYSFDNPPTNLEESKFFLEKFMAASRVDSFLNAINKYKAIKTDTGLIEFYRVDAEFITSAIYEGMQKSYPAVASTGDSEPAFAWSWVNSFLPIKTEFLSSEAGSEVYKFLPDFSEKSKSTKGELDDELFKLLNFYYDDYDGTWLTIGYDNAGCDYCGYSTFGNGEHITLFKKIILIEKQTQFLDKELNNLVSSMINLEGTAFKSSQADIIKEIDAFLSLKDSTRFNLLKWKKIKQEL